LNAANEIVQTQLQRPDATLIETFSLTLPKAALATREMFLFDGPPLFRGAIGVQFGIHVVILPPLGCRDFYQRVQADRIEKGLQAPVSIHSRHVAWPSRAVFRLDFAAQGERGALGESGRVIWHARHTIVRCARTRSAPGAAVAEV
jgi:hypothetical protein